MTRQIGDRPGDEVAEALDEELMEEFERDSSSGYYHEHDPHVVGRLVQDDEGLDGDHARRKAAWDSHDETDLSAEESAIHYEEDTVLEERLSDDVLHDLEQYED